MVPRLAAGALVVLFALAAGQDIRGLGMGRLTLVLESEDRPFDMYGFGGNPAGLFRSQLPWTAYDRAVAARRSVLELYVPASSWRYAGELPYEWAVGNPLPGQFQECFPQYMTGSFQDRWYHLTGDWIPYVPFAYRPSGVFWRYRGTYAFAVHGAWSYAAMGGTQSHISTPELDAAAAVPLGPFDIGLELPASLVTDALPGDREQSAFVGYRLGVVVPLRMLQLGAALSQGNRYAFVDIPPIAHGWISVGTVGSYALQAMFAPAAWFKLGVIGGHSSANTGPVFTSPWASLSARARPMNLPILAALTAEWARMQTNQPTFEVDQMDSVGIGAGLGVEIWRLRGGAELHFAQRTYPEDTGSERYSNWTTNAGAELRLGVLQVRLGYEHSVRPIVGVPGVGFNRHTATAGLGLTVASVRADIAWNHSYWPFGNETEEELHLDLKHGW